MSKHLHPSGKGVKDMENTAFPLSESHKVESNSIPLVEVAGWRFPWLSTATTLEPSRNQEKGVAQYSKVTWVASFPNSTRWIDNFDVDLNMTWGEFHTSEASKDSWQIIKRSTKARIFFIIRVFIVFVESIEYLVQRYCFLFTYTHFSAEILQQEATFWILSPFFNAIFCSARRKDTHFYLILANFLWENNSSRIHQK